MRGAWAGGVWWPVGPAGGPGRPAVLLWDPFVTAPSPGQGWPLILAAQISPDCVSLLGENQPAVLSLISTIPCCWGALSPGTPQPPPLLPHLRAPLEPSDTPTFISLPCPRGWRLCWTPPIANAQENPPLWTMHRRTPPGGLARGSGSCGCPGVAGAPSSG